MKNLTKKEIVAIKNEDTNMEKVIKNTIEVMKDKLNLDEGLIREVIKNGLLWLKNTMQNPTQEKILFNYLGTFKLMTGKVEKANERGNISKGNGVLNFITIIEEDKNENDIDLKTE